MCNINRKDEIKTKRRKSVEKQHLGKQMRSRRMNKIKRINLKLYKTNPSNADSEKISKKTINQLMKRIFKNNGKTKEKKKKVRKRKKSEKVNIVINKFFNQSRFYFDLEKKLEELRRVRRRRQQDSRRL
ncbi:MAG: hypothetical protein GY823_01070 [Flavobacteriaceae bacterium]|nr:hypothetical protein [Flavobacteriaceae bacterium]